VHINATGCGTVFSSASLIVAFRILTLLYNFIGMGESIIISFGLTVQSKARALTPVLTALVRASLKAWWVL
jgi:hypothetical protein